MSNTDRTPTQAAAIQPENGAFLVSLELSQSCWLVTLSPPDSQKFSCYTLKAGESERLLRLLDEQRSRAERRLGRAVKLITIYEAGLDGFWLHRVLEAHGIESHVVDRARSPRRDGSGGRSRTGLTARPHVSPAMTVSETPAVTDSEGPGVMAR